MAEEMKEKDPACDEPHTPAKQEQETAVKRARVARETGKAESNDEEKNPDDLKMKTKDSNGASNKKIRQKMKRHWPKVFNENKSVKPSTPKLKTPKPPRQVRKNVVKKAVDGNSKRSCKRKLEFSGEHNIASQTDLNPCSDMDNILEQKLQPSNSVITLGVYGIAKGPKKKRKMRKRLSLEKLIRLVGMINEKSGDCDSTILNISWTTLRMRRSSMRHIRRQSFSRFLLKGLHVVDAFKPVEQCEHPQDNVVGFQNATEHCQHLHDGDTQNCCVDSDILERNLEFDTSLQQQGDTVFKCMDLSDELVNILPYQDGAVQEALADFATQKMKSLCIHGLDEETDKKLVVHKKHEVMNDKLEVEFDEESTRIWKLFLLGVEDTEGKKNDNDLKQKKLEEERKHFATLVDSFNHAMFYLTGDRRFTRWKGSVVDSVVGVFLTQNTYDNLSSDAFLDLAARYPPPSLREQNGGGDAIEYTVLSPKREESNPNIEVEIDESSSATRALPVEMDASSSTTKATLERKKKNVKNDENWDDLRKKYMDSDSKKRGDHNADTVDWKAVREASHDELANLIKKRGMSNQLAGRIKMFLDRLVRDHGSIDLEWLRNVPPLKAKSYLMSFNGLALKSTECVRLLSLYQPAFPIDVNLARVLVRLEWVKLQPLPDGVEFHLLNNYPEPSKVQEYIWPRICKLDEKTLYELHCYMNIFSKAFCTMRTPNCNQCPMRGKCKHYASALASSQLHLEGSHAKNEASESCIIVNKEIEFESDHVSQDHSQPIVEYPTSPEPANTESLDVFVEDCVGQLGEDIEDFSCEPKIQTIMLNNREMLENPPPSFLDDGNDVISKILLALTPQVAQIHLPKLKNVKRLRTEHQVYELPDSHPLLAGFERRDCNDPCHYLLAVWTANSCQEPKSEGDDSQETSTMSCSSDIVQYGENETVKGTILIPCRTANRGRFPLNGTYFQINEVFADHDSSLEPIDVPRKWIWNLPRRTLYCGTSISWICKGMLLEEIERCFQKGYICIRGFDLKTRTSQTLNKERFHFRKSTQKADKAVQKNKTKYKVDK